MAEAARKAATPHMEPSEVPLEEGVPTRVDLVAGDKRLPMALLLKSDGRVDVSIIDPDQAWFWGDEWFEGEVEAAGEIRSGGTAVMTEEEFLEVVRDY